MYQLLGKNNIIMKVISLGLGVQSTAMYYMSSLGEIPRADYAIFSDTGGEKTATLEYLKYILKWQEDHKGIPIIIVNDKNLTTDLLAGKNSTGNRMASIPAYVDTGAEKEGMMRRQCTMEYKIAQVDKAIRKIYDIPGRKRLPITEIWNGITLEEMHRMIIPRQKWKLMVYPFCGYTNYPDGKCKKNDMPIMRRGDVIEWYRRNKLPIPVKSSCKFCPFASDASWLDLKRNAPQDFADAVKIDLAIRNARNMQKIKNPLYLHKSLKPLSEVEFDENQTEMWGDCYGFCHV